MDSLILTLNKSAGRDKIGKFFHFLARFLSGYYESKAIDGSKNYELNILLSKKFKLLWLRIMESRRTVRWLGFLGLVSSIKKDKIGTGSWKGRYNLHLTTSLLMICWYLVDHIKWLQQIEWLSGDQRLSKRVSFGFFSVASFLSGIHFTTRDGISLDSTKHWLNFIVNLHISELYSTGNITCGLCGTLSSIIDIYKLWPKKKKEEELNKNK